MALNGIEPTLNLRLAQAYGTRPLQARPTSAITPVRPIGNGNGFDGGLTIRAASLLVRQQIDTFARTAIAPKVLRVVGGRVPDSIDFTVQVPKQMGNTGEIGNAGNALPMYRHPADRNDAATRINLGGLVDIDA